MANSVTHVSKMRNPDWKTARNWYLWLWLSPVFTVPSALFLYVALHITLELVCTYGGFTCRRALLDFMPSVMAVFGSALWHLFLLIPALDNKRLFVRWHGRQALALAGARTLVALVSVFFVSGDWAWVTEILFLPSICLLIAIWFFGTLWGQIQAGRGDCGLARWRGREEELHKHPRAAPVSRSALKPVERAKYVEALVNIIRYSDDAVKRREAVAELHRLGLVEQLQIET